MAADKNEVGFLSDARLKLLVSMQQSKIFSRRCKISRQIVMRRVERTFEPSLDFLKLLLILSETRFCFFAKLVKKLSKKNIRN